MVFKDIDFNRKIDLEMLQDLWKIANKPIKRSAKEIKFESLSFKKSDNKKAILYQIPNSNSAALVKYQLFHEDGQGSILFALYQLRKLYEKLDKLILAKAKSGNLSKAELFWIRKKNMDINLYTHRLQIFRIKQSRQLSWIIDADFHQTYSDGSRIAVQVLKSLLLSRLNQSFIIPEYCDRLDEIVKENWVKNIADTSEQLNQSFSKDKIKLIYRNSKFQTYT
jgi:hypothetical protein